MRRYVFIAVFLFPFSLICAADRAPGSSLAMEVPINQRPAVIKGTQRVIYEFPTTKYGTDI